MNKRQRLGVILIITPLVLVVLILSFSNSLYKAYFITEGKTTPMSSEGINISDDVIIRLSSLGESLDITNCMKISGWAVLLEGNVDQGLIEKTVILKAEGQYYALETSAVTLAGNPPTDQPINNGQKTGFSSCLSKYFLKIGGRYQIGVKFENTITHQVVIGLSNTELTRTPNKILVNVINHP